MWNVKVPPQSWDPPDNYCREGFDDAIKQINTFKSLPIKPSPATKTNVWLRVCNPPLLIIFFHTVLFSL